MKKVFTIKNGRLVQIEETDLHKKRESVETPRKTGVRFFTDVGLSVALPLVGGSFLGFYLDQQFETKPVLTLVCLTVGLFISLYSIYKMMKDVSR